MSDEELAAKLAGIMLGMQEMNSMDKWWHEGEIAIMEVVLGWLRKPAEVASDVLMRPKGEEDA
jgi:hypothetical protein